MLFLIIIGGISFIFGIMLVLLPKPLKKMTEKTDKVVVDFNNLVPGALKGVAEKADRGLVNFTDFVFKYRQGVGLSLILIAACLWFIVYYMQTIVVLRNLNQ